MFHKYEKIIVIMSATCISIGLGPLLMASGLMTEAILLIGGEMTAVGSYLYYSHKEKLYEPQIEDYENIENAETFDFEEIENEQERLIYEKNQKLDYGADDFVKKEQVSPNNDFSLPKEDNELSRNLQYFDDSNDFDDVDEMVVSFFKEDYQKRKKLR